MDLISQGALGYLLLSVVQHQRAEVASEQLAAGRGHQPHRLSASPGLGNLLVWRVVYEHDCQFVGEWVGAPYLDQQRDPRMIFDGLEWLERSSQDRFGAGFADDMRSMILDMIALADRMEPGLQDRAVFLRSTGR